MTTCTSCKHDANILRLFCGSEDRLTSEAWNPELSHTDAQVLLMHTLYQNHCGHGYSSLGKPSRNQLREAFRSLQTIFRNGPRDSANGWNKSDERPRSSIVPAYQRRPEQHVLPLLALYDSCIDMPYISSGPPLLPVLINSFPSFTYLTL